MEPTRLELGRSEDVSAMFIKSEPPRLLKFIEMGLKVWLLGGGEFPGLLSESVAFEATSLDTEA